MSISSQTRRRRNIRMAEGYLDLALVLDDQLSLDHALRTSLSSQAIECLNDIDEPVGHLGYILFLKGQAYRAADQFEKAVYYLEQSNFQDPENHHTYLALAWCYKRTDRLDSAIEIMQTCIELDPECAIAHYNLACYCALQSDLDLALMHLSFALDLDPDLRNHIEHESDFDLIRDNPKFAEVISATV